MWTLYKLDENVQRPIREYPSKDDALRAACDELKKAHVKVELIEGPDGEKIDKDAIEQYCRFGALTKDIAWLCVHFSASPSTTADVTLIQ